jgi:hypothetical protein
MRPTRALLLGLVLGSLSQPAFAFQETTVGGQKQAPPPVLEAPKAPPPAGKQLNLSVPELSIGKESGTEIRIPGIGAVGKIPKLDFGLELLYGAGEQKGMPQEKTAPDDVQIRGTIKHRF